MSDSSDSAVACLLGVFGGDSDGPTGCLPSAEPGDKGNGVRRSSRLARKLAAIEDWPVHRILDSLYSRGASPPRGCDHKNLFTFFVECGEPAPSAPPSAPAGKRREKRGSSSLPAPGKKARGRGESPAPAASTSRSDPVLTALLDIKMSLADMGARVGALEHRSAPAAVPPLPGTGFGGTPPTSDVAPAPRWNLASALPAAASGVPFLSPAAGISAHLRSQILSGRPTDVNLVKILLCSADLIDRRVVECGEVSVLLKGCDPRMLKNLTLPEFYVAFGVYRDTLCEVYPERRIEFDDYMSLISDLAMRYGGTRVTSTINVSLPRLRCTFKSSTGAWIGRCSTSIWSAGCSPGSCREAVPCVVRWATR